MVVKGTVEGMVEGAVEGAVEGVVKGMMADETRPRGCRFHTVNHGD